MFQKNIWTNSLAFSFKLGNKICILYCKIKIIRLFAPQGAYYLFNKELFLEMKLIVAKKSISE